MTRFAYEIFYTPCKSNGKADALTRRPGDIPDGEDERQKYMEQVVLKMQTLPDKLHLLVDSLPKRGCPSIPDHITKAYQTDPLPGMILNAIRTNSGLQEITVVECAEDNGRLRYRASLNGPDSHELRLRIIQEHHDTALAGHAGRAKMIQLHD